MKDTINSVKPMLMITWGFDLTSILAWLSEISDGAKIMFAIVNGLLVLLTGVYMLRAKKANSLKAMIEVGDAEADRLEKLVDTLIKLKLLNEDFSEEDIEIAIKKYKKLLKSSK